MKFLPFLLSLTILLPQHLYAGSDIEIEEISSASVVVEECMPSSKESTPYTFKATELIAPVAMIGLGVAGLEWKGLKKVNHDVTDALWGDGHTRIRIDNVTQFLPFAANYALNLCGVKGLHDYIDLTIITATAGLLTAVAVYPAKKFIHSPRPSGAIGDNSFPSGHTAWAFAGAEIMRREFSHVSPWIGVSGYLIATGTAFLRLYNGAHWLTDVVAGAGIGLLCAEAAYWLYPVITKYIFPRRYNKNIFLSPTATRNSFGVAASITF